MILFRMGVRFGRGGDRDGRPDEGQAGDGTVTVRARARTLAQSRMIRGKEGEG